MFDEHDWNHLHNCVFHVLKKHYTKKKLEEIFEKLPEDLKDVAKTSDMVCNVWQENFIHWLESTIDIVD